MNIEDDQNMKIHPEEISNVSPKTVASILGEIVWLMSQSPKYKSTSIGELETLIMPAILLRQFRIFYNNDTPVGSIVYARTSKEGEEKIKSGKLPLDVNEWKSGPNAVVISVIAPFGGEEEMKTEFETQMKLNKQSNLASTPQGG